jgi:cytochrome P450
MTEGSTMSATGKVPTTEGLGSLRDTTDRDPFAFYTDLQDRGELVWDEEMAAWLAPSYALNKEIALHDDELWQMPFAPGVPQTPLSMSEDEWMNFMHFNNDRSIMHVDEEGHAVRRQWILRGFSASTLKRWRSDYMLPVVDAEVTALIQRGSAELCADFADRVASRVFHQVLGLPSDDEFIDRLDELDRGRFPVKQAIADSRPNPKLVAEGWEATKAMIALVEPHVMARASGEGDDFISMIWRDADELYGDGWEPRHIIGEALNAWTGGTGTTRFSTANALYLLVQEPRFQDELRAGGHATIRAFVEESLRLYGPLAYRPRWAKRDVELGGQLIKAGEKVIAVSTAAGRDEARYGCPLDVDLARKAPRDHFSFWQGPHTCPGQGLARVELEAILDVLLAHTRNIRFNPDAPAPEFRFAVLRRWQPLHVVLDAA